MKKAWLVIKRVGEIFQESTEIITTKYFYSEHTIFFLLLPVFDGLMFGQNVSTINAIKILLQLLNPVLLYAVELLLEDFEMKTE